MFRINLVSIGDPDTAVTQGWAKTHDPISRMMDLIAPQMGPVAGQRGERRRIGSEIRLWYVEGGRYLKMHEVWGQVAKGEICTVCVTVIDLTTFWITIDEAEEKGVIVNEWSMEEDKAVGVWRMQRSLRPIATINTTASATFLDLVKQVPSVDPRFTQLAPFRTRIRLVSRPTTAS